MPDTPTKPYYDATADETVVALSTTSAEIEGIHVYNTHSAVTYLQIFDAAAGGDITLGTTVPSIELALPATGWIDARYPRVGFDKGIVYAVTATSGSNDAPGATAILNLFYRN